MWHFSEQRWEWSGGWMCCIKLKDRFPSKELRETRYRWHSIGITAEQAAMVWECAAKKRWWFGEEMHGVWSRGSKTKSKTKEDLVKLSKRTVKHVNWTHVMLWIVVMKLIRDVRWSGWVWVGGYFFWYRPTRVVLDQRPLNGCVCVFLRTWKVLYSEFGLGTPWKLKLKILENCGIYL